ncbi:MAG TPA: pilus assembly protein, partial [Anaerolineae bacterium]|nr:pilus assembly protein [Anaerolineae bacterium]
AHRGQSLVEVALFFPIFIILLAGVAEVANIIITQNRVTSATRASTRFAADGGEDSGIVTVLLNTVTQTQETSPDVWDVWSIRGTVNANGDGFDEWQFTHIYGISATTRFTNVNELDIQAQVLQQLQTDEHGDSSQPTIAGGLRIVGTYATHDINSILGLNALPQYANINSAAELSVMRITGKTLDATAGCTGFPIAVHEGVRSVTEAQYTSASGDVDYPATLPGFGSYPAHTADVPLLQAEEGDLFFVQEGLGNGNFGWLTWNEYINSSDVTLTNSLTWPGDSADYTNYGDGGSAAPGYGYVVRGFLEAGDPTDQEMNRGDWVAGTTGSHVSNGVRTVLNGHIDQERTLRLIVWNNHSGTGNNGRYQISGFAVFRLLGYSLNQGGQPSWILAEFIRWDNSCGQ